jgi:hypothetical protein
MQRTNASVLFAPAFDSKKLFIIMIIVAVTLIVDTEIGTISDMIPEQLSSYGGIAGFVAMWMIFVVTQYYVLAYIKKSNKESRAKVRYVSLTHGIVTIAQFVLGGVFALVILQIFISHAYNATMLYASISISYGLWIVTLGLLARAFFLGTDYQIKI